jgi:hypothetical protein
LPIASLSATSSSAIFCASVQAMTSRSESFAPLRRSRMRPMAQARLTAVGRVLRSIAEALEMDSSDGSLATASAMPNAAATPMSGAPRTRIVLIASATSCTDLSFAVSKTCGRRCWSMIWITPWASSAQRLR